MLIESESCPMCRFESTAYTNNDVAGTLRSLAPWWRLLTDGVDERVLAQRPSPTVWSAIEYAQHSAAVTNVLATALTLLLRTDGIDFGDDAVPQEPTAMESQQCISQTLDRLEEEADRLLALLPAAADSAHVATMGVHQYSPSWVLRHACHDALHHLQDVGRGLHAIGSGVAKHYGEVVQINTGRGGVPKLATDTASVGYRGIAGDKQSARVHHGRVWQALCLYSIEAIDQLRDEGHSISAGAAGENLTLSGLQWPLLRPNTRIRIGSDLEIELSVPALPCKKNAQWFHDGNFMRMHHEQHPGETRWYARVMTDGEIQPGDAVVVEPS